MGLQNHALGALEDIAPGMDRYNAWFIDSDHLHVDVSLTADVNDVMFSLRIEFNAVIVTRADDHIVIEFRVMPELGGPARVTQAPWMVARTGYKYVKSLQSGNWCQIAEDSPLCCDPSTETYWSM